MRTFTLKERFFSYLNLLPVPIYDSFAAPLFGHALTLAVRLNIFETLRQPLTAEKLAKTLNIHPQASFLLLSSLVTAGYIKKIGNDFVLSASAKKWLLKSSPYYIGNFIRYVELLYSHWLSLEQTFKKGKPPSTYIERFGEKEWKIYIYGMMDLAKIIIPHIISKMILPNEARTILDLGGSHGLYSIELCKRHPRLHATIVDFPQVLRFTKEIIREHNVVEWVSLKPGNVLKKKFRENFYDAALAFNIVHGLTPEQNEVFLRKISRALKRGGYLYVLDQFVGQRRSRSEQLIPLMVGINIMNEVGGTVYSIDELRELTRQAGLRITRSFRLRLPGVVLLRLEKH